MDNLKDVAEFWSQDFAPFLPDEAQVNPGCYGAELAFWLSAALARQGIVTSYPASEDWGWYIEYSTEDGSEFAVHCGNVDGSNEHWLVSLQRVPKGIFGRGKPQFSDAATLVNGLKHTLSSSPSISRLSWHWGDEHA